MLRCSIQINQGAFVSYPRLSQYASLFTKKIWILFLFMGVNNGNEVLFYLFVLSRRNGSWFECVEKAVHSLLNNKRNKLVKVYHKDSSFLYNILASKAVLLFIIPSEKKKIYVIRN
jgi:hypothetical protein